MNPAIVVTGASSGIGREIARMAAPEGCFLLLVGHSKTDLSLRRGTFSAVAGEHHDAIYQRFPTCSLSSAMGV
jgi:short-subunit dehydrogenase